MRSLSRWGWIGVGCALVLLGATSPGAAAQDTVRTVAGTGSVGHGGDGGAARLATLDGPSGIAVDAAGDVAVADTGNCRVRWIAGRAGRHFGISMKAQHIYTVAGTGCGHRSAKTSLVDPTAVAFDPAGDLLIADGSGDRIFELPAVSGRDYGVSVTADRLTSVAGTGVAGTAADGHPARTARLDDSEGIAVDGSGDLYIADTAACQVDEVFAHSTTGAISTVAGTGVCGDAGDGGPAVAAQLWSPSALALDGAGDLLIADEGDSSVREVPAATGTFFGVNISAGDIATVAGQGIYSAYLGDGLSATGQVASLNYPSGLALDAAGDLFIADSFDRAVREVPAHAGTLFGRAVTADDMYTVAGLLPVSGSLPLGDGTRWILTRVTYPSGVAVGPGGALYFSDRGDNVVRRLAGS